MKTDRLITEIIRSRYSCRSYDGTPISPPMREKLADFLKTNDSGPFGTKPRFTIFAADEKDNRALKGLGTYGFIRGASAFIVGASTRSAHDLEDYGYLMEKKILFATDLGLGTCWLGGSFRKSVFSQKARIKSDEYVPAIAAAGNIASRKRLFDIAARFTVSATKRKPFDQLFYDGNFQKSLSEDNAGRFKAALEMVRLAPSAANRQPCRIVLDRDNDVFHFYLERTKNFSERNKKVFGMADMQRIDMGISMCHFELALDELGINGEWVENDPGIDNLPGGTEYVISRKIL